MEITEKAPKTGKLMHLLKILKNGEFFYTETTQKAVQAYAANFKVKIKTQSVLIVEDYKDEPKTLRANKVTIIKEWEE